MKKLLPINEKTISNIYLLPCILLSILLKDEKYHEWYMSQFIQLCAGKYQSGELIYRHGYVKVFYEATQICFLESLFYVDKTNKISSYNAIQYIINTIEQNAYTVLDIDEYYIENTYYFNRVHYYRKFLVYGYDAKSQILYLKSHDKFTNYKTFIITYQHLESILKKHAETSERINFDGFLFSIYQPHNFYKKISPINLFYEQYYAYINGKPYLLLENQPNVIYTYGIKIYEQIMEAFQLRLNNLEKIDYRALALIAEHKRKLAERLEWLQGKLGNKNMFQNQIKEYFLLEKEMKTGMNYMLHPYGIDIKRKKMIFKHLLDTLANIKKQDEIISQAVLDKLKKLI